MDPVQRMKTIVFSYNESPNDFSDEEAEQVAYIAAKLGLPFRPESKALSKFFFDLVDNATFGLLPDDQRPVSRGQSIYGETKGEKAASLLSMVGLAVPGALGAKAGVAGARAIKQRLPKATQQVITKAENLSNIARRGTEFAGWLAAMDLLEDPMGAPQRALTGAALGGAIGSAGLLRYARMPQMPKVNFPQMPNTNQMTSRFRDPLGLSGIGNVGIQI